MPWLKGKQSVETGQTQGAKTTNPFDDVFEVTMNYVTILIAQ